MCEISVLNSVLVLMATFRGVSTETRLELSDTVCKTFYNVDDKATVIYRGNKLSENKCEVTLRFKDKERICFKFEKLELKSCETEIEALGKTFRCGAKDDDEHCDNMKEFNAIFKFNDSGTAGSSDFVEMKVYPKSLAKTALIIGVVVGVVLLIVVVIVVLVILWRRRQGM